MVLDSSAIVAIHLKKPGHDRLIDAIDRAEIIVIGAPTLLETAMVLTTRLGQDAATTAFLRFGRGRHPAALNFGDCMSYAVASVAGLPLLFTGEDFAQTDIARA